MPDMQASHGYFDQKPVGFETQRGVDAYSSSPAALTRDLPRK
jgi:hypothetical protein